MVASTEQFQILNRGCRSVFQYDRLTLGLVIPIENYSHALVPEMHRYPERVPLAEELGFTAIWLRDVPFNVSSLGDAGQTYEPFVYLGLLAGKTYPIALNLSFNQSDPESTPPK